MFGDKLNLGSLLKNAHKMKDMMKEAQAELEKTEVIGEAMGGAITITMNGRYTVKNMHIDDDILKESKEVLQDLLIAAINDATKKAEEIMKSKMMGAGDLLGATTEDA